MNPGGVFRLRPVKLERRFLLEDEQLTFHLLNFRHDKTARFEATGYGRFFTIHCAADPC
jgi:hypothetical protein